MLYCRLPLLARLAQRGILASVLKSRVLSLERFDQFRLTTPRCRDITLGHHEDERPSVVLDNLLVEASASVVLVSGGDTLLAGSDSALSFDSWASGYQFFPDGSSKKRYGFIDPAPQKPLLLLDSAGAYFTRSKPQYEDVPTERIVVVTDHGVSNAGEGDQTEAINSLLSGNAGSVIFFPAGVHLVEDTVQVPVGSRIIGSGWSQIMGTGPLFEDEQSPKVLVQVGQADDRGVVEITDIMFTVRGPTAGAIFMEWNVHEEGQGSGMS